MARATKTPKRVTDFKDATNPIRTTEFVDEALVECPRCQGCAKVTCRDGIHGTPRLTCSSCLLVKRGWPEPTPDEVRRCARIRCPRCNEWLGGGSAVRFFRIQKYAEILCSCGAVAYTVQPRASLILGGGIDPYLRLPLWLRTEVRGNVLWAYNRRHLAFLDAYIRADLRERAPNWNSSMASRLPCWMKLATMRDDVLKGLTRIARKT